MTPLVPHNLEDKREITETNNSIQRGLSEETFQPEYGRTFCPEQSDRSSIPTGTSDGEDVPDHETVGGELGASRSMKTSQKNACWVASKRQRPMGKVVRNYQGGGETTQQQRRHSAVHRFL